MRQQPLTVWIICKYGSPKKYGVASKSYRLAKYLSENNVNTYLITSDSNHLAWYPKTDQRYNWEEESQLKHVWIKTMKYNKSASLKRILSWFEFEWYLRRLDTKKMAVPDVVLVSSLSLLSVLTGLHYRRKFKSKLVFEVRDIYPLTLTEELGVSTRHPMVKLLGYVEKLGYKKADLIVGTMPNLSSHVANIIGYEKKVFFSPLGINDYWAESEKPPCTIESLFPKRDCVVIGYAGSMGRTNALESFIGAIESLKDNPNLYFVLVGQGDLKETYADRLKDCANVVVGPRISQAEIPAFLEKCDILYLSTHPSKIWDYGQSMNKLVDYMMAGKPVVASYSGYPSMLNESGSGMFIEPYSTETIIGAIERYASMDQEERESIGRRGKEWLLNHYSNEIVGRNYLDEINSLSMQQGSIIK